MTEPIQILGIAGSLRAGSYNKALLRAATRLCPPTAQISTFDLGHVPFYDADLQRDGDPAVIADFKDRVRAADALLICTPEYNHAMPGVLKNAIDWLSRPLAGTPLEGKPVGIMGASDGPNGTVRAQQNLRLVLASTYSLVMVRPTMFVRLAAGLVGEDGEFTDAKTLEHVEVFMRGLVDWAIRFRERAIT